MNKKNNVINIIINLAKAIMSEADYNKFISYLKMKLYGRLRLFVEEVLEMLQAKAILYKNDPILEAQIIKCRRLDVLVTDLYVDKLVSRSP